jgi:uncharacterized membrane protein YphA (DoxX/SURF4 family)
MDIALWIVQVLLALAFLAAGALKLTRPKEKLDAQLKWPEDFSLNQIRLIGAAELLGAIGLILPAVTDIVPVLTAWAALGLAVLMAGAVWTHRRREEPQGMAITGALLLLAAFVAWGRFGPESF